MSCEITVCIKDDEKTLRTKFYIYEDVTVNENDPVISRCVEEVKKNFASEPTDISVRINLEII